MNTLKFIDLFAGIGGMRLGLESAAEQFGIQTQCVLSSEIKKAAIKTYEHNFAGHKVDGDIHDIAAGSIPDFDVLLGGFPCQPFSYAGKGLGFADTRGSLFFEIHRILEAKKPKAFILENVEGLVLHDRVSKGDKIGRTLSVIITQLEALGYKVSWQVLNAAKFGSPQSRKRVYILGRLDGEPGEVKSDATPRTLGDVLIKHPKDATFLEDALARKLLEHFSTHELTGKQIKDSRGGTGNIHSWDIELRGPVTEKQRHILELLLLNRRRKSWAASKEIPWRDGMPMAVDEILSFCLPWSGPGNAPNRSELKKKLDDLVAKSYLALKPTKAFGRETQGYDLVSGKLSFQISHILDPKKQTPTLVATDAERFAVIQDGRLRRLTAREGLRLFDFPDTFDFPDDIKKSEIFDLLGNSVNVKLVRAAALTLLGGWRAS